MPNAHHKWALIGPLVLDELIRPHRSLLDSSFLFRYTKMATGEFMTMPLSTAKNGGRPISLRRDLVGEIEPRMVFQK
jgi:hypothetical protein